MRREVGKERDRQREKVSISSTFYACFFHMKVLFLPKRNQKKAAEKTFVQKTRAQNIDEIDQRRKKKSGKMKEKEREREKQREKEGEERERENPKKLRKKKR